VDLGPLTDRHALPLGVFAPAGGHPRVGVRYGDDVVDIAALAALSDSPFTDVLAGEALDAVLAAGRPVWEALRAQLIDWRDQGAFDRWLIPLSDVRLLLPWTVRDYVDFYASEHHATAVGRMFRPGQPALPKAWKHLPQGYHGRAGTVVVSGTPLQRPSGLRWTGSDPDTAVFGPTQRLDVEVEVGFVCGTGTALGRPVTTADYRDQVFGFVVLNDWSARDIQAFETVPLGPHTGKSFMTSVSPWVVPLAAVDHLRRPVPAQADPSLAAYLVETEDSGLDLDLELTVNGEVVARQPFSAMYWSPAQLLAQLTVTGARIRAGDLYASGTVSGPEPAQAGSLLELWRGQRFLADGDEVSISATAAPPLGVGERLDLGTVAGRICSVDA
jgi:fumarylacetoacetase